MNSPGYNGEPGARFSDREWDARPEPEPSEPLCDVCRIRPVRVSTFTEKLQPMGYCDICYQAQARQLGRDVMMGLAR